MFSGDMMTVNVNLSGLPVSANMTHTRNTRDFLVHYLFKKIVTRPFLNCVNVQAIVVRSGLVQTDDARLPVGLQFIGRPFG